jgi:hypothetical protein
MPDSQSHARLPCPIHDDDSGRRRAENSDYPMVAVSSVHALASSCHSVGYWARENAYSSRLPATPGTG